MLHATTRQHLLLSVAAAATLLIGCASNIKATRTQNPPPTEAYSAFGRIEVRPVTLAAEFANDGANRKALVKIQENLDKNLGPSLAEWNQRPDNGRKLVLQPVVEEIRFIGVGARIFTGPLSGSSVVRMTMKATDTGNGKAVDNPEFYQRSSAGAGFALGVADNLMLTRTASLMSGYIVRNFTQAVGGPTGANDELVAPAAK